MQRVPLLVLFFLFQHPSFASAGIFECYSDGTKVYVDLNPLGSGEYSYEGEEGKKAGSVESRDFFESTFHVDLMETLPGGEKRRFASLQVRTENSDATFVDAECNHIEFLKCKMR